MRILIVGAGAIGGYLGACLEHAGIPVTFLVREKRFANLQKQGIRVNSRNAAIVLQTPSLVTAATLNSAYDLIILATKAYDLKSAIADLAPISHEGFFLPFLNGWTHLSYLDSIFGKERVMAGVARFSSTIKDNIIEDFGVITPQFHIGHRAKEHEFCTKEFYALCQKTVFEIFYSENIEQELWNKWVELATLAACTILCRSSMGKILETPYGEELIRKIYNMCAEIAEKSTYPLLERTQQDSLSLLLKKGSLFTSSMLRDLQSGRPTEHEAIFGPLIDCAEKVGINADFLKAAYINSALKGIPIPTDLRC